MFVTAAFKIVGGSAIFVTSIFPGSIYRRDSGVAAVVLQLELPSCEGSFSFFEQGSFAGL